MWLPWLASTKYTSSTPLTTMVLGLVPAAAASPPKTVSCQPALELQCQSAIWLPLLASTKNTSCAPFPAIAAGLLPAATLSPDSTLDCHAPLAVQCQSAT